MRSVAPAAVLTSTARTRVEPSARVTAPPAIRRAPAALAAASMLPGMFARGSMTAATAMPARARSATVRAVSSLLANTTARRPGATA